MNNHSYLCRFIAEHPEDWETLLAKQYCLRIKRDGRLAIFNYEIIANFYDPIVQEARGIILDVERLEVVCWPFRKFGNHSEGYADTIDWSSARVLEKVDGSIVKLWFDHAAGEWQFSTNRTIRASLAGVEGKPLLTYGALIASAENYGDIPFDTLDRDMTYIFELVSPDACVVIHYDATRLYHLGTRHNLTGEECEVDIGIIKPASYPLASLEDCLKTAAALNRDSGSDEITGEGFVVVDKDFHRVKVKSLDYVTMHHVSTMRSIGKHECVDLLLHDPAKLKGICAKQPVLEPYVKYYEYRLAELLYQAEVMGGLALSLYEEYSHDRRAVAAVIAKHPLSFIGFKCIDSGKGGRELLLETSFEKWVGHIPDYAPEDIVATLSKK